MLCPSWHQHHRLIYAIGLAHAGAQCPRKVCVFVGASRWVGDTSAIGFASAAWGREKNGPLCNRSIGHNFSLPDKASPLLQWCGQCSHRGVHAAIIYSVRKHHPELGADVAAFSLRTLFPGAQVRGAFHVACKQVPRSITCQNLSAHTLAANIQSENSEMLI